jgi:hypothetical protein
MSEPQHDQLQNLTPIPAPRRVITGHNVDGKSIVLRDEVQAANYWSPGSVNPIYDFHRTNEAPAQIDSEIVTGSFVDEIALDKSHNSPHGSVFRSFEFAPGTITVCSFFLDLIVFFPFFWINYDFSLAIPSHTDVGLRGRHERHNHPRVGRWRQSQAQSRRCHRAAWYGPCLDQRE